MSSIYFYQRISCSDTCGIDRACYSCVCAKEGYTLDGLPVQCRPNTDTTLRTHTYGQYTVLLPVTLVFMPVDSGWKPEYHEGTHADPEHGRTRKLPTERPSNLGDTVAEPPRCPKKRFLRILKYYVDIFCRLWYLVF